MTDENELYSRDVQLLAKRTGLPLDEVADAVGRGRTAELFDQRGRFTGQRALDVLDGCKLLYDMELKGLRGTR